MDHLGTALLVAISPDPLPCRNGSFPWIGRVKYPILSCPLPSRRNLPHYSKPPGGSLGGSLRQASSSAASRPPAIDLKLRLALRVAALAAVCFIAVAAYTLFDSDRAAKAKASRIAEIV